MGEEIRMDVIYPRCCGLDVHKDLVVACLIVPGPDGRPREEIRRFGTMTADLKELSAWLLAGGCTVVAMESTGPYWKPVWNLLEHSFALVLVNPQHMKAIPGRKTDQKDCQWIAQLLRHGLLRPSFVPERLQRELRELTRYRTKLIEERSAEVNRLQKTLEGANLKLGSVVSDITGKSARAILAELAAGNRDAPALAKLALGKLRSKEAELAKALEGELTPVQAFLLAQQLAHIDHLDEQIATLDARVAEEMAPFADALALLETVPGIGRRAAEVIVAELGVDMGRFPSAAHAAAWAGMAPGNHESAGKRLGHAKRRGNKALGRVLVQAAWSARRTKTYLGAQFGRLARTRGAKRAAVAVGHSILVIAYHILKDGAPYQDLGHRYFEERNPEARQRWLVRQLEAYDLEVTVTPKEVA
jgi:transposase